jgi:hypothetical protein
MSDDLEAGPGAEPRQGRPREVVAVLIEQIPEASVGANPLERRSFQHDDRISGSLGDRSQLVEKATDIRNVLDDVAADDRLVAAGDVAGRETPGKEPQSRVVHASVVLPCRVVSVADGISPRGQQGEKSTLAATDLEHSLATDAMAGEELVG